MTPTETYSAPYANKAIVAMVTSIAAVIVQYLATDTSASMSQEGTTALTGAIVTVLVYAITNSRKLI